MCVCVCERERDRENTGRPVMTVWRCHKVEKVKKDDNEHPTEEVALQKHFNSACVIQKDSLKE